MPVDLKASVALDVSAATVTVDNGGTFAVQVDGAALTALQLIDDVVATLGTTTYTEAATKGTVIGAVRNDALGALVNQDNEIAPLQVDSGGALYVELTNSAGAILTSGGGGDNISNATDSLLTSAFLYGFDGTTWDRLRSATATGLEVDIVQSVALDVSAATLTVNAHAVTNAGTFAVQVDGDALTALQLIDNIVVVEDAVHGSGDSGVMALSVRNDALAALVGTDGDYAPLQVSALGGLFTHNHALNVGGCKMFNDIDLDQADIDVATGACTVYAIYVLNTTAGILHLKLFNTNSVTMGSTAANASLAIPGNADSDGAGFVLPIPACGLAFSTALTVAVTGASGLTDSSDPGAGAAIVTILYQD